MYEEISKLPKDEGDRVLELPNSYREKGREEGRQEGIKEGLKLARKHLVQNMLKKGLADELIADVAEMTMEQVKEIKEARKNNK